MFRALCAHHQEVKLYYTASGIVTPVGGRPVHRLREDWPLHVSSTMCTSSGGQIVLYSIWYHHTCFDHLMMSTTVLETYRGI